MRKPILMISLVVAASLLAILGTGIHLVVKQKNRYVSATIAHSDLSSLDSALQLYRVSAGEYPSQEQGLQVLVTQPAPSPPPWRQLLAAPLVDPWGRAYRYEVTQNGTTVEPVVRSLGPDEADPSDDFLRVVGQRSTELIPLRPVVIPGQGDSR